MKLTIVPWVTLKGINVNIVYPAANTKHTRHSARRQEIALPKESNPGPGYDRNVRDIYSNICRLHDNLNELAVPRSDYDVMVCAESKVSDRRHLSELRIPLFGCPQQWLRNSTQGAQGMALNVREGFLSLRQSNFLSSCRLSCVFRICSRVNNIYVNAF